MVSLPEKLRADFSARLNAALDEAGVPAKHHGRQVEVARMFRVSQKGARKWLEGEAIPHQTKLVEIAQRLNVSADWLVSGRGKMRPDTPIASLDHDQQHLIEAFAHLPAADQREILADIEARNRRYDALLAELLKRRDQRTR